MASSEQSDRPSRTSDRPRRAALRKEPPVTAYKRVLLKLSGEVFGGGQRRRRPRRGQRIAARDRRRRARAASQVAIVVGGGNFFRGAELQQRGMDRARADYMGMLGMVMNCLALQDFLEKQGVETRVQTAITMGQVAEPYIPRRAIRHLEKGRVVIFGAGAGMPYFSTDTVAAQRALETRRRGRADGQERRRRRLQRRPARRPDAMKFDHAHLRGGLHARPQVADATAFALCRENDLPHDRVRPVGARATSRGSCRVRRSARGRTRRLSGADAADPADVPENRGAAVINEILNEADSKMDKAVEATREEFAAIRAGRANPAMFCKIMVDYYGTPTPIQQLASFTSPEARVILISAVRRWAR